MRRCLGFALVAVTSLLPHGAQQTYAEGIAAGVLSPSDAVEKTLQLDPEVAQARAEVELRRGILREETGRFDQRFLASTDFVFDARELIGDKLQQERDRRLRLDLISRALEKTASDISGQIGGVGTPTTDLQLQPQCDVGLNPIVIRTEDERRTIICRDLLGNIVDVIVVGKFEVIELRELLKLFNDPLRGSLSENLEQEFRRRLALIATLLRTTSTTLRVQFERLGVTPDVIEELSFELSLSHQFRFRNGSSVSASLFLQSSEENYEDKPLDPNYGDSLLPNTFTSSAGFSYTIPLGKGGGKVSAGAAEAVAREQLTTALEVLSHEASRAAARTLDAYWSAAAARERLAVRMESEALLDEIVAQTKGLVEGDQLARVELDRAESRRAEARREVALARQELLAAQYELAREMGLAVDQFGGDFAVGNLPRQFASFGDVEDWISTALSRRHDVIAASHSRKASEIAARATKADLKPRIDFSLNASYNALYESFDDRLYDFSGFSKAWDGKIAGPSYGFKLQFFFPVGNHTDRGRHQQAESALTQSRVQEEDLRRSIRLRLRGLFAESDDLRARLSRLETAEAAQASALEGTRILYKGGELSLIDTLVTESQVTELRLGLIETRERLARFETNLRFEAGRLLEGNFASSPDSVDLGGLRLASAGDF